MSSDNRTCYYPDGTKASGSVPCSSDENTNCCGQSNICLTNGYCLDVTQPFVVARGACTSKSWGTGCPIHCTDTFTSIGTSIIQLSYIDGVALYCCGTPISSDNGTICPFGKDSFQLDDADMIPGRAGLADYVLASNSSSSSSSNSSASNSATTSSSTSSIASSTTTPSTSSGDTTSSFSPSSHDAALGAGLGIPLGVIAIASVVWALWERRRANSLSRAMMGSSAPASRSRFPGSHAKTDSSVPTELDNGRNVAELMT